ncbi:MAG: glycosyltransferase family 4 protein [Candidatus Aureabacteria bacterium]|nr:glycosyltransferase family 4 protein [Candidatus Auribacterota bacterium]
MKVAFLTTRREKPSYRFRVQQFLPYLQGQGVVCDSYIIPRAIIARWRLFRSLAAYDIVFLQKKVLRFCDRRILRLAARRLVYDVDDAIMYRDYGDRVRLSPRRNRLFRAMVRMSDAVFAGNDFICRWAANYSVHVVCLRTVVDTDHYTRRTPGERERIVIGWMGSSSTNRYLTMVLPVLEHLAQTYPISLLVVSDTKTGIDLSRCGTLRVDFTPWDSESEVRDLHAFDIGLMPLPDNELARGKCALKALLYMSSGVPAVCSSIGAVRRIITDGEDGFLAASPDDWHTKIERLIKDAPLRERIAEKARRTVESYYSVAAYAPRMLRVLSTLFNDGSVP